MLRFFRRKKPKEIYECKVYNPNYKGGGSEYIIIEIDFENKKIKNFRFGCMLNDMHDRDETSCRRNNK